jgi:hypothetical protein
MTGDDRAATPIAAKITLMFVLIVDLACSRFIATVTPSAHIPAPASLAMTRVRAGYGALSSGSCLMKHGARFRTTLRSINPFRAISFPASFGRRSGALSGEAMRGLSWNAKPAGDRRRASICDDYGNNSRRQPLGSLSTSFGSRFNGRRSPDLGPCRRASAPAG